MSRPLHVGIVEDSLTSPERFLCASERTAVVPIPSLTSADAFDSAVLLAGVPALRLFDHGRQAYAAARRIETPALVRRLDVLRSRGDHR